MPPARDWMPSVVTVVLSVYAVAWAVPSSPASPPKGERRRSQLLWPFFLSSCEFPFGEGDLLMREVRLENFASRWK